MKIAVTGATGYVGSRLSEFLREHSHEVLALSRRPVEAPWAAYTLGDDPDLLPWYGVDVLIHLAYDFTARNWQEILDRNVNPSIALFQAARRAGVRHLIFISSLSSFEGCRSDYGKAKLMIEKEVMRLEATVIRPGLVWGKQSGGVMGTLETLVARLPVVPYLAGGNGLAQYLVHEEDLARAILVMLEKFPEGVPHPVTIANPTSLTLRAILRTIATRTRGKRLFVPAPWQFAMVVLKTAEMLGVKTLFRSDSLTGIVHGNPDADFSGVPAGLSCRPFC
ncbi:MAG: NAD-dependent epimerase/dehydratase family protein [Luteolibacter sp.]